MELDALGRLAVAQALYQAVGKAVATKDPSSLRGRMDADAMEEYVLRGVRTRDVIVAGEKVGTYSVSVGNGKPRVVDEEAFEGWARESGFLSDVRLVDWDRLTADQRDAVVRFAESIAPGCAVDVPMLDAGWSDAVERAGAYAVDSDGQVVPGVEWASRMSTSLRLNKPGDRGLTVAQALASMPVQPTLADVLGDASAFAALPEGGEAE